ncbi:MAG TPA: MarR family winged helix-turn-helix transcriptional regulator [Allosphingosinicella sp.]
MRKPVRPVFPPGNGDSVTLGRLGDFVGFRLRRVQNQLSRDFASATADRNLRSGLFSSLALISANPGISQNELSKETALDKSVIVTIVDELELRGWATRERSKTDRRRHALFITRDGESYLNELFQILEHTEDKVLHQLSRAELHMLHELLDRMYSACVRDEAKEEA